MDGRVLIIKGVCRSNGVIVIMMLHFVNVMKLCKYVSLLDFYCVSLSIIVMCIQSKENAFAENNILHYRASCMLFMRSFFQQQCETHQ